MTKLKVYIAAPWEERKIAIEAKEKLEGAGYVVTSRWIDSHLEDTESEETLKEEAFADINDILEANMLVLFNQGMGTGKHVETGLGIATLKSFIIVGE